MPGAERAEIYFISAMMILIFILCGVSIYFFFKTYKKEMREREERQKRKAEVKRQNVEANEILATDD